MTKGVKGGECARTACSNKPATYFNKSTKRYYCPSCAALLNRANYYDAVRLYGAPLCELEAV